MANPLLQAIQTILANKPENFYGQDNIQRLGSQPQPQAVSSPLPQVPINMTSFAQNMPLEPQSQIPQGLMQSQAQVPTGANFRDFLVQLGIPLATTAVGLASESALPAAAGFQAGYTGYQKEQRDNKQKEREAELKQKNLIDLLGAKTEKSQELSPSERNLKRKMQKEFSDKYSVNQVNLQLLDEAEPLVDTLPQGLTGKATLAYLRAFDSSNPVLGDWQKVKSLLTDTTLLNTMKTKGAITDREMDEFKKAAANDDLISVPRIKAAFQKYRMMLNAENEGALNSFWMSYGEDPRGNMQAQNSSDSEYSRYLQIMEQTDAID